MFDHFYSTDADPNDEPCPPPSGRPHRHRRPARISLLKAEELGAAEFGDALELRLDLAGSRGGTPLPASVLLAAQTESKRRRRRQRAGLFRPKAFWAVLYISDSENPADPFDAQDVLTAKRPYERV